MNQDDFEKMIKAKGKKTTVEDLLEIFGEQLEDKKRTIFSLTAKCITDLIDMDFKLIPLVKGETRILLHNRLALVSQSYELLSDLIRTVGGIRNMTDDDRSNYNVWYLMNLDSIVSFYIERKDIDKLIKAENDEVNRSYT